MAEKKELTREEAREKVKALRKPVRLKVQRTSKEDPDIFVSVNNKNYLIQRGVEVEVPHEVYSVLQHMEQMQDIIMRFEEANAK